MESGQVTTRCGVARATTRLRMTTAISPSASSSRLQASSSNLSHQGQGQNPISLRLYKVLGANFDDEATREALNTLAELYAPPSAPHTGVGKGKDVTRDLDADKDADEEYELNGLKPTGLAAPAGVEEAAAGDIAARARKNLRRDVESKLAESSKQFLKAFGEVDKVCVPSNWPLIQSAETEEMFQQLDTLQEHIGLMRVRCDESQSQLFETNEACKSLLDRAGSLREERCAPCAYIIPPAGQLTYSQARHLHPSIYHIRIPLPIHPVPLRERRDCLARCSSGHDLLRCDGQGSTHTGRLPCTSYRFPHSACASSEPWG